MSTQDTAKIAARYAESLMEAAIEKKALESVAKDISKLHEVLSADESLKHMLSHPAVSQGSLCDAMVEMAKKSKAHQLTQNFFGVLAQNGRMSILPQVVAKFLLAYSAHKGEVKAHIESAVALTPKQKEAFAKIIKANVKAKDVEITTSENPALLGGSIIQMGSVMIDDSVKSRLERLERAMRSSSDTNQLKEAS